MSNCQLGRIRVSEEKEKAILEMRAAKKPVSALSRVTELTRLTVYKVLRRTFRGYGDSSPRVRSGNQVI
jgi:hypothetical protein